MPKMTLRRRPTIRCTFCGFIITLVFITYQFFLNTNSLTWLRREVNNDSNKMNRDAWTRFLFSKHEPFKGEKLIHLDLKGAPPLISYLTKFIPFIKKLGATGILIEYEDMFPYRGELEDIRALNAYQPSDIRTILELAATHNLSVIPLVNTFGHFEYVLKLKKFSHLREISKYPQVLCPTHTEVKLVIHEMIDQMLEAHPKVKYIHLGCDEVYYLGKCERCVKVLNKNKWEVDHLFLNHVRDLALYVNKTHPGVRPIIWGDMIAQTSEKLLKQYNLASVIDLMVWKYGPDVSLYITDKLLSTYARLFKNIWIASAFKGATEVDQLITNARYHLQNHVSWMKIVGRWKDYINFKGIALTGWQRYDHFSVLCELLPVGIPSLALNLYYLVRPIRGNNVDSVLRVLQCDLPIPFADTEINDWQISRCNFPGFVVFRLVTKLYSLTMKMNNRFSKKADGWFSTYNIAYKFSSPAYMNDILKMWPVDQYRAEVITLEEQLKAALSEVYDEYTVKEWIMTHLTPKRLLLDAYYNAVESLLHQDYWPRRPLNSSESLAKVADEICNGDKTFGCGLLIY